MQFTSQLSLAVLARSSDRTVLRLQLPIFVWLVHDATAMLDPVIEPVFYLDDTPLLATVAQMHLLRGATQAACEEAWSIYLELISNDIPEMIVRQLLPANLMCWGTVEFSDEDLKGFVAAHRDSPTKELALIAQGYERVLTDDN